MVGSSLPLLPFDSHCTGVRAQTVANDYLPVLEIDANGEWLRVTGAQLPAENAPVLLYQAGGAAATTSGILTDLDGAGRFQTARVVRRAGDTLYMDVAVSDDFSADRTQVVTTDERTNRSVTEDVDLAEPYDGFRLGGVLFFAATDTLFLDAHLDAAGGGFSGADGFEADSDCNRFTVASQTTYAAGNWRGSPRGNGVVDVPTGRELGRGALANGGGGGNDHNAGGGGGANVSNGGDGGRNIVMGLLNGACRGNFPGFGGQGLPAFDDRAYLGGGGGAGHANNTATATGGNGGGLIVLWATTIVFGPDATLIATGNEGATVGGDGAGGGGAGGTILLLSQTISGSPTINLRGGGGGDVNNLSGRCFGPGGGGSGGRLVRTAPLDDDFSPTLTIGGGTPGLRLNSDVCSPTDEPPGSGTTGRDDDVSVPLLVAGFGLSADTLCAGESLLLSDRSVGGDTVTYTVLPTAANLAFDLAGDSARLVLPDSLAGDFHVVQRVMTDDGDEVADTVSFVVRPTARLDSIDLFQNPDRPECYTFRAVGAAGFTSLRFFFGDGNSLDTTATEVEYCFTEGGDYLPAVRLFNAGCGDLDRLSTQAVRLGAFARAVPDIKTTTGCVPFSLTLDDLSTGTYAGVRWAIPGATPAQADTAGPLITLMEPGSYVATLTLTDALGPDSVAQVVLTVLEAPPAAFTFAVDTATANFTAMGNDTSSYRWDFGDGTLGEGTNTSHDYTAVGIYTVILSASNGPCTTRDTQLVTIDLLSAVADLEELGVRYFPNPTEDEVRLTGPGMFGLVRDPAGRIVGRGRGDRVILRDQPNGWYLVDIHVEGRIYPVRILRR